MSSRQFVVHICSMTNCPFCEIPTDNITMVSDNMMAFPDKYPVTKGHHLIIPKEHKSNFFDLNQTEVIELQQLLHQLREKLSLEDSRITGFNIGANCGKSAGQTVYHCHVHLIPRRSKDVADPTGGVRGVISEKQKY